MKSIIKLFLFLAVSLATLDVLADGTNSCCCSSNFFCRVTFGSSDGTANNYTAASGYFGQIPFSQLTGYTKADPGSNYHETDTPFGDYYLVPVAGVYQIVVTLRDRKSVV